MPSIASHFVVAKLINERIKVNKSEFYKGAIAPDVIDSTDSHFHTKGKYYLIPDIDKYRHSVDLQNDFNLGYICHLLLDKYFLEEYVLDNVKDYDKIPLFSPYMMYNDYTNMNVLLINKYKLDLDFINMIMKQFDISLNEKKYKLNVDSINDKAYGKLRFIDFDKYCTFLEEITDRIILDIKR